MFFAAHFQGGNLLVLERNAYPGKKLNITGKGRCNLTNDCNEDVFLQEVFDNPRFLYSALHAWNPQDTIAFFKKSGLPLKIERGKRVFPTSDRAHDVTDMLVSLSRASIRCNEHVKSITRRDDGIFHVRTHSASYCSSHVVIATGGCSYPTTGSTGDGYRFAESFGHTLTPRKPALVGVEVDDPICSMFTGLSLKNVELQISCGKNIRSEFGEMLFTHYGISGPAVLRLSPCIKENSNIVLDLKPAISERILSERLQRDLDKAGNKMLQNAIAKLLPKVMIMPLIQRSGCNPFKRSNIITADERGSIVHCLKHWILPVRKLRPISEAVVTSGGVCVREVNPRTMESKLVPGLYLIGEVLDVAANTGGFNLQIAFATAFQAAQAIGGQDDCH